MQPQAVDDPWLGREIGSYRLTRLLGRGGMGRVYLGTHPTIGSRVAIKVLSEDASESPDLVERFFAEAKAINMIRHENIVSVHDFLRAHGGRPAIVMELIEGKTLHELAKAGEIAIEDAVKWMIEVLSALSAAHAIGIVHRDIKPDNIMITASGRVKLLDFGIAKLALAAPGVPRTSTGSVLGTPQYMSPEQIQGGVVDVRSDIYSLGVVLFELLASRLPFTGTNAFEVMAAHVDQELPSIVELRPSVPLALAHVVEQALAKNRGHRFASSAAMAHALDQWSSGTPVLERPRAKPAEQPADRSEAETRRESPVAARVHAKKSRRALVLALALFAVAGVAGIVIWSKRDRTSPDASREVGEPPVVTGPGVLDAMPVAAVDDDAAIATPGQLAISGPGSGKVPVISGPGSAKSPLPTGIDRLDPSFDGKPFEPVAFYTKALELARKIEPDAQLTKLELGRVGADGMTVFRPDTKEEHTSFTYWFISETGARKVGDKPDLWGCGILVQLDELGKQLKVYRRYQVRCDDFRAKPPKCSARHLWAKALAKGYDPSTPAELSYEHNVWRFSGRRDGEDTSSALPDDCALGSPVGKVAPAKQPTVAATNGGAFDDDKPAAPPVHAAEKPERKPRGTFATKIDADAFEPIKFIAKARELARTLEADAELVSIRMTVEPDGRPTRSNEVTVKYLFRSVKRGMPETPPESFQCMVQVGVQIEFGRATTERESSEYCYEEFVGAPRCSLEKIWAKALTKNVAKKASRVKWNEKQWTFDGVVDGSTQSLAFRDDCK